MDYYSMNRKQLQALCKQHNIPANSANSVLADNLSNLLNEKQKPTTRQRTCLKTSVEGGEPAGLKTEAKKVRFCPNNELLEYELRSGTKKQKHEVIEKKPRRKPVANKVESVGSGAQTPVRITRSSVQLLEKDAPVSYNEKKKGKKAVNDVDKVTDVGKEPDGNLGKVTRSKVHTLNKGAAVADETSERNIKDVEKTNESVEVGRVRVTRSKVQSLTEDVIGADVNTQLKKRSSDKRVVKDAHSIEPSTEITDIPVRVTRTRGQILKEDNGNMVTNDQGVKKRTRKEMKSTDSRINLGNVATDDNQEVPKRKSLRTRGVETVDEDEAKKLVRGKQKKQSKESVVYVPESQHHVDKGPRQSRRNAVKGEGTEVTNQNISKVEIVNNRRVTRSKQKMVHQPDESSDQGEKKVVNRRKSVMQKTQGKEINKPLVGKRESSKATVMVESPTRETPKTVGKTRSNKQSGNLSLIDKGLEAKENVTRSGKDTSVNEIKAVVNPVGSPKSIKRRGTPIVEDQTVKTKYVSTVDESPRHSALSSSKSEGKPVAKKQVESSLKTPTSRKNNQLSGQNAFPEVNKENSSKKRAKLSGTNQRHSENHSEISSVKGVPVSKLGKIELDEEARETESTPVIESHRQVTHSAIRNVGKKPSKSAIQDQPIAKFRPNPVANTAGGRVTRSGIKHGGKAAIFFSEKVDKKKQVSQSALRKRRDATHISSPEGAEVGLTSDVDTIGVQSEISKASESVKLPPVVPEENMVSLTGTAIVKENFSPVSGENASGIESHTISNIKLTPDIIAEKPEVYATTPDAVSDRSHVQNETLDVSVKTTIFREAEVQVAINAEKPVADEIEMVTKQGSPSKGLQIDLMAEEPAISVDKTVVVDENEAGSSAICHVSVEQSDINGNSNEMEDQVEPSKIENVTRSVEDDGIYAQLVKGFEQDGLTCKDSLLNDTNSLPLRAGNKLEDSLFGGNDGEDGIANATDCQIDSLPSSAGNKLEDSLLGGNDREDGSANATDCLIDSPPSTSGYMIEDSVLSGDIYDDVEADGGTNVPKELETGLEPANVPVSINNVSSDFKNNRLTSIDSHSMDDQNVGGEDSEIALNDNIPVVTEGSIGYRVQEPEQVFNVVADEVPYDTVGICASVGPSDSSTNIEAPHTRAIAAITVDSLEESILDINKEALSNILGDAYETRTENDSGFERKISELAEGVKPKESETSPPSMGKEQTSEMKNENDHMLDDQVDHTVATVDLDLDGGKFMEDCSNHGVEDAELLGIITSDEHPTREENSPIMETKAPPLDMTEEVFTFPDSSKWSIESLGGFDGETQPNATTNSSENMTYGSFEDYSRKFFGDEVDKSSDDGSGKEKHFELKGDHVDQTMQFDLSSEAVATSCDHRSGLKDNSITDELEKKEETQLKPELFNIFDFNKGETLPNATTNSSENMRCGSYEDYSRKFFGDEIDISNDDGSGKEKHFELKGETQPNATTNSSENMTYESFEDYSRKFFGDDIDNSSDDGSGKEKHFELKGDRVDQTKQFDLASEAVATSSDHASGFKGNSITDELEKKEETQPKPELFNDLDFDKGVKNKKSNTQYSN